VAILDVVLALALYVFLKPVNKSLSLLAAWFRLVYATILGITLLNLIIVLELLTGADYLTVFETDQLHALGLLFLNAFSYGWQIGIVFFGLHLFVLGYLIFKSGYIPRILGVLLIIGSLGYLIDSFAQFLLLNYDATITLVGTATATIGELLFMFWLLLKGRKIPEMKNQEEASA
jgi:hypothetical protein